MTRYSEEYIYRILTDPNYEFIVLTADDIFGTLGLCAFCVIKYDGTTAVVEGFMMSCRVFGRHFEDMFLTQIIKAVLKRGCGLLIGLYTYTDKNKRFGEFYSSNGFKKNNDVFTLEVNDSHNYTQQVLTDYFSEVTWIV